MADFKQVPPLASSIDAESLPEPPLEPLPGEFYFEGPYMVMTEDYHLRRGWCCKSNCRHCPFGYNSSAD